MTGEQLRSAMAAVLMLDGACGTMTVDEVAAHFNLPAAAALPDGDWVLTPDALYDCFAIPPGLGVDRPVMFEPGLWLHVAAWESCRPFGVLMHFRFGPPLSVSRGGRRRS